MTAVARMDATRATTTTALMVHPQKEWEVAGPTMFDVQFYLLSIRILGMSFSKSAALKYKYLPYLSGKNRGSRQDTRVSCHACRVSHEGKTPRPGEREGTIVEDGVDPSSRRDVSCLLFLVVDAGVGLKITINQ